MVWVHRNLNRAYWTVRDDPFVISHVESLNLEACEIIVQPGAQARARPNGQRNVRAYVKGRIMPPPVSHPLFGSSTTFFAFRDDAFMSDCGEVITAASAHFDTSGHLWVTLHGTLPAPAPWE
ncbi:hypothetical protein GCM10008955_41180 [Deinococcus malanensis]|uniref:Uncharacterized protein n=1 Tax=Deinococcus malanensis TaxID=1706855 RepID=A0ABQ2F2K7_9DEIO|nr:hypothetical protein GCM10008955_41180 [Deinococcus malanensis]